MLTASGYWGFEFSAKGSVFRGAGFRVFGLKTFGIHPVNCGGGWGKRPLGANRADTPCDVWVVF